MQHRIKDMYRAAPQKPVSGNLLTISPKRACSRAPLTLETHARKRLVNLQPLQSQSCQRHQCRGLWKRAQMEQVAQVHAPPRRRLAIGITESLFPLQTILPEPRETHYERAAAMYSVMTGARHTSHVYLGNGRVRFQWCRYRRRAIAANRVPSNAYDTGFAAKHNPQSIQY